MMERYRFSPDDIIAQLQRQIAQLERDVELLKNRTKTTIPVYNKSALPDMIDQEIFLGTDHTINFRLGGVNYNAGP